MKLLLDQNVSHRLVQTLADLFPDSEHVRNVGLKDADDEAIWQHAKHDGFIIVSKDTDFHQRSVLLGHPPKVVWVALGNCATQDVERALRMHANDIERFVEASEESFLVLTS